MTEEAQKVCLEPEMCDDWLYDYGDPSTGIEGAWVCQKCGNVDFEREPPSYDD